MIHFWSNGLSVRSTYVPSPAANMAVWGLEAQRSSRVAMEAEIDTVLEPEVTGEVDRVGARGAQPRDAALQVAPYVAAVRVLTRFGGLEGVDHSGPRGTRGGVRVRQILDEAVRIATRYVVPQGLHRSVWLSLTPEEQFYLRGLEVEAHGEHRHSVFRELAFGLRVKGERAVLAGHQATRMRLPSELEAPTAGAAGLGGTDVRQVLLTVGAAARVGETGPALARLRRHLPMYWGHRHRVVGILRYLARTAQPLPHWRADAAAASRLADAVDLAFGL